MRDGDKLQTNSRSQEDLRTTEELDGDQTGGGREEEEEEEEVHQRPMECLTSVQQTACCQ